VRIEFWWGNPRERDRFEDLGVDGMMILKRALNKLIWMAWTGLI